MEQLDLTMDSAKLKEWRQSKKSKQPSFDWADAFPHVVMHKQLTELNSKILTAAKSLAHQKKLQVLLAPQGYNPREEN